ncbi:MAG: SIS domain-containing protein [Atopobiaceae bacterium]|nr:SIS domain-containing protein [Atopobiaceae bacterium]
MRQEHIDQIEAAVKAVRDRQENGGIDNFYFVACGGSQASMMPIQYMFDREIAIPSAIYNSNEFNYGTPKAFGERSVVITISHSGTTPETVAAAQKATDACAVSICLTNIVASPLWQAAKDAIHYDHGQDVEESDKSGTILLKLAFSILAVVDADNVAKWEGAIAALDKIKDLKEAARETFRERVEKWATANKRADVIYTMGSGVNYGEAYSLAICLFMEMQWINSSSIHSGEYFHGPFEITDYDVPFVMFMSCGATRYLDERALAFAQKFSDDVLVIDENEFEFGDIDEAVREYLAPEVLGAVVRVMVDKLAHDRGHALSVRRYMWQMEY